MEPVSVNRAFKALGTDIYLEIIVRQGGAGKAEKNLTEAEAMIRSKESGLSRFRTDSDISRLNRTLGVWNKASADIIHLAEKSLEYHEESQGLFDPRIIEALERVGYKKGIEKADFSIKEESPASGISHGLEEDLLVKDDEVLFKKRMDFSGIAKGYICDLTASYLKGEGWEDFLVDTGGDMFLSGLNAGGTRWIIDIEGIDPAKAILGLSDEAVATSGITRRSWMIGDKEFHHLINPKDTDDFKTDFLSVSVVSDSAESSDAWAKILFLSGKKAYEIADSRGIKAIFRLKEGEPRFSEKINSILVK